MSLMLFYMANPFHLARTPRLRLAHLKRPTPHASRQCPIHLNPRLRSALFERAQETEVYACDVEACIRLPSRTIHVRNLGASVPSSYLGQVYFILGSLDHAMESCDFAPRINMLILKSKPSDIRERPLAHATILIGITEQAPDFLLVGDPLRPARSRRAWSGYDRSTAKDLTASGFQVSPMPGRSGTRAKPSTICSGSSRIASAQSTYSR